MTEQVDLDAVELRAMRFHKLNPLHECFDSTTVLALIAELRQETRRADTIAQVAVDRLNELRQERGRADKAEHLADVRRKTIVTYMRENADWELRTHTAERALSRAEETIAAVDDFVTRHYLDTQMGQKVLDLIAEYDKQKAGLSDD